MNGMNRMKVWKVTAVFAALLMLPLLSAPAHADGFSLGAIFRIGGIHFNLTFGDFGYGHPRGYYYRTADPISYGDTRCNSYCFNSGGYHYHHESCPLVRRHLATYDIDTARLYERFAPGYGDRYDNGYGYGNRYDDYDSRYDRDDRYDDSYDRSGGYRQNGNDNRYDNYPYRDRDRGYGRHNRYDDRRHRGHSSSGCPLPH